MPISGAQRIDEMQQCVQRLGSEDSIRAVLRWIAAENGPHARQAHRRTVAESHDELRAAALHELERLSM
jgi:hypothetical protein